jgi:hypothetical protein
LRGAVGAECDRVRRCGGYALEHIACVVPGELHAGERLSATEGRSSSRGLSVRHAWKPAWCVQFMTTHRNVPRLA